jgi:hypothetical protein
LPPCTRSHPYEPNSLDPSDLDNIEHFNPAFLMEHNQEREVTVYGRAISHLPGPFVLRERAPIENDIETPKWTMSGLHAWLDSPSLQRCQEILITTIVRDIAANQCFEIGSGQ